MANLLTKAEILARIKELNDVATKMPNDKKSKVRACEKCLVLYTNPGPRDCWCDFESDRIDY